MEEFERMLLKSETNIAQIVNGGCPTGIDEIARRWAKQRGVPIRIFEADWTRHKKAAGPIRNRQMAANADVLIAFMKKTGSPGTLNMIEEAKKRNLKIFIFTF